MTSLRLRNAENIVNEAEKLADEVLSVIGFEEHSELWLKAHDLKSLIGHHQAIHLSKK